MRAFTRIVLGGTLAILLASGCFMAETPFDGTYPQGSLTLSSQNTPVSKMTIGNAVTENGVTTTPLLWSTGDKVGVFGVETTDVALNENNVEFTVNDGGYHGASFGLKSWNAGTFDIYAYYPYIDGATLSSIPFQIPERQVQSAADNSYHLSNYGFYYAKSADQVVVPANGEAGVRMEFASACAILEFEVVSNDGRFYVADGSGGYMNMTLADNALEGILFYGNDYDPNAVNDTDFPPIGIPDSHWVMDMTSGVPQKKSVTSGNQTIYAPQVELIINNGGLSKSGQKAYMLINPYSSAVRHRFNVYVSSSKYGMYAINRTIQAPSLGDGTYGFRAGRKYIIKLDGSHNPALTENEDTALYLTSIFTDLSDAGTQRANTYVVEKSDQDRHYAFQALYEGNTNYALGTTIYEVLAEADTARNQLNTTSSWSIGDVTVGVVELDWASPGTFVYSSSPKLHATTRETTLISDIKYMGSYITFTVKANQTGNAILSAKTAGIYQGTHDPLWSWHIWVVDTPIEEVAVGETGTVFMDRNLGAIKAASETVSETYGLYYQWGRKDPLPSVRPTGASAGTFSTMASTVRYPFAFNTYWMSRSAIATPLNYWLDWNWPYYVKYGEDERNRTWEKKGYDPCPYGWKLPNDTDWEHLHQTFTATADADAGGFWHRTADATNMMFFPYAGHLSAAGEYYTGTEESEMLYYSASIALTGWPDGPIVDYSTLKFHKWSSSSPGWGEMNAGASAGSIRCVKVSGNS